MIIIHQLIRSVYFRVTGQKEPLKFRSVVSVSSVSGADSSTVVLIFCSAARLSWMNVKSVWRASERPFLNGQAFLQIHLAVREQFLVSTFAIFYPSPGKNKRKNDHFSSLLSITPTCVCSLSFQTASQDERAVFCCALQLCLSIRNPSGGIRSDVLIMESFLIFLSSSSASLLKVRRIPQAAWKDLGGAAGSRMDLAWKWKFCFIGFQIFFPICLSGWCNLQGHVFTNSVS